MRTLALVVCLALPFIGCAQKPVAQPIAQFPSRDQLDSLPELASAAAATLQTLSVDRWKP